jgi:hypothetical protein
MNLKQTVVLIAEEEDIFKPVTPEEREQRSVIGDKLHAEALLKHLGSKSPSEEMIKFAEKADDIRDILFNMQKLGVIKGHLKVSGTVGLIKSSAHIASLYDDVFYLVLRGSYRTERVFLVFGSGIPSEYMKELRFKRLK